MTRTKTNFTKIWSRSLLPTIDPVHRQCAICARGPQYRSALFYANDEQKQIWKLSKTGAGKIPAN